MLAQLGLEQSEREAGPVNGHVENLQRVGQAPDVVLVAVSEEDPDDIATLFQQVRDVGQHEVDAEHVVLREHQARVDDEDLVLPLEGPHVDAHLAEAAERQVAESPFRHNKRNCSASCLSGSGSGGGGGARSRSRYLRTLSKSRSRSATSDPLCSAAAGWYRGTYAMSPRSTRLPWTREIDPWPGKRRSSACRPRMSTTFGLMSWSCRWR